MEEFLDDNEQTRKIAGGLPDSTLRHWIRNGLWTPPVATGAKKRAWPHAENVRLAEARIAGLCKEEIKALVTKLMADREKLKAQVLSYLKEDEGQAA